MDIFSFIHTPDPTKVRIVKRERNEEDELEASIEKLFDEGGSGNQTDQGKSARGGPNANIQLVVEAANNSVRMEIILTPWLNLISVLLDLRKEKFVEPSSFGAGSSSAGGTDPITGVFFDLTSSDFLVGSIRTIINPYTDLQKVYIPQWSVMNGSCLDDDRVCREMVDEFAPLKFFTYVHGMEHDQLFTDFNVRAACQISLSVEVRMRAEYNVKEKRRLESVVEIQDELLKARKEEIESLKAWMLLREKKAAKAIRLHAEASNFETMEKSLRDETNALRERNVILKKERNALDVKVHELEISFFGLQEKVTVYENCMEQLEKFQDDRIAAIGKAIEKGMQDGLSARITHGEEGRVLSDVDAYNPSAEVDYISALQQLQNVNFSLLLMVPIHHSPNQVVVGATSLSLTLDVSSARIRKIRENIANQRSALRDVFVPLVEPFFAAVLTGTEGTSDTAAVTADTTMVLSTIFASASIIAPISVDDYEVLGADDQAIPGENVASFPVLMMQN
uniref:Transposase (Putative), gypsy type n=1 Tax=Tanacetum cinerariifolium TaxID=118510 RepID=A0A6L2JH41_TANCI|nr:hypothetical protein [Tanacetum cinerariifolium]